MVEPARRTGAVISRCYHPKTRLRYRRLIDGTGEIILAWQCLVCGCPTSGPIKHHTEAFGRWDDRAIRNAKQ